MEDPKVLEQMRADWNRRAAEDAYYYVAFGRQQQDDDEFFATGLDVVKMLRAELKRLPGRDAALEIGCGPGRLMRPLAAHFGEIHGVDVSDEMIRRARELLRHTPNAHPHAAGGSDLALFPDEKFDFVYSYAVFQHIPSRDVVFQYLREARRVLKPGGVLRCQLNGLPPHAKQYDTWSGVRVTPEEIRAFTRAENFQLLALEDIWTQYMWMTCRKPGGAVPSSMDAPTILRINNALTGEAVAPDSGYLAALSLLITSLPAGTDLNSLSVTVDNLACRVAYIGPPAADGVTQVNAILPPGVRTGLLPAIASGAGWSCAGVIRIIPAGPAVPRVAQVTDGVNLLLGSRTSSGIVKVRMLDLAHPEQFRAAVDGRPVPGLDAFCTDLTRQTHEFNFHLPEGTAPGMHELRLAVGRRELAPLALEVV
jgi:SAM-dependent methyltransferase